MYVCGTLNTALAWRSKVNLQESVLSFHHTTWIPGIELRWPDLVASAFIHGAILQAQQFTIKKPPSLNTFVL